MDDRKMANQAAVPNQAAAEAQDARTESQHSSGGSAILDAEAETNKEQVVENKQATNITNNSDKTDPTDAKNFNTTGNYPADAERIEKDYS